MPSEEQYCPKQHSKTSTFYTKSLSLFILKSPILSLSDCQCFHCNETPVTQEVMSLCGCPLPLVINRLAGNVSPPPALSLLHIPKHTHIHRSTQKVAPHVLYCIILQNHNFLSIILSLDTHLKAHT